MVVGGLAIRQERAANLRQQIETLCAETGIRPDKEIKWQTFKRHQTLLITRSPDLWGRMPLGALLHLAFRKMCTAGCDTDQAAFCDFRSISSFMASSPSMT